VTVDPRRVRDFALLDIVDSFARESFSESVWRVVRENRDPLQGGRSPSRWCVGTFDVLYTSLDRDGALAEVYELLNSQPVWPSKIKSIVHRIGIRVPEVLRIPDMATLARLGVDVARFREREYSRTQEIADAAYFLGFSGLIVPNARWPCGNLVVFTERIAPAEIQIEVSDDNPTDLRAWRERNRGSLKP